MKLLPYIITASLLVSGPAAAATIQRVEGLTNGKVRVYYSTGRADTKRIFSVTTTEHTLVEKLSSRKFVALRSDGRKLALTTTEGPNDFETNRLNLVDDVRYTSAYLGVHTFSNETLPVVVAKRGANTEVLLIDYLDDNLEILDQLRFVNRNIVPDRTQVNEERGYIKLRNSGQRVIERATAVGSEDLQLVRQRDAVNCAGQWYETHTHMEDLDALDEYVNRLEDNNEGCALLFVGMEWEQLNRTYDEVQAIVDNNPGRFIPFYNGDPNTLAEISVENLQAILDTDTDQLFKGIGEFAFYREPLQGTTLTADPWPDLFSWAADNNLIIMVHLNQDQGIELDTMLDAYPNTTVLLHGKELVEAGDLATLLAEHSNLYFTLDTANMVQVNGVPVMFPADDSGSDRSLATDFVATYNANEAAMLTAAQTTFADIFSAAPGQVLWGTDTAYTWHARPAVHNRLLQFSESFAAMLTADQQDDYFTNNAQALLGDGVTLP